MIRKFAGLLAVFATLALAGCGYNDLQRQDEGIKAAWSEVLNQYQRRADLVPNLVNTVKGYAAQEEKVLIEVTNARASVAGIKATPELVNDPVAFQKFIKAQGELTGALSRLLVVSENYPQLKSDALFRDLTAQLEGTENRITVSRNRYIKSVQEYNTTVRQFPTNLTAMVFKMDVKPNFTVENEAHDQRAAEGRFQQARGGTRGARDHAAPAPRHAGDGARRPRKADAQSRGVRRRRGRSPEEGLLTGRLWAPRHPSRWRHMNGLMARAAALLLAARLWSAASRTLGAGVGGGHGRAPAHPAADRARHGSHADASPAEAAALETKLADWEARTSNQLVVLLVPTTQPEPIEAYSLRVAEKWKIGRKGQDNGALFLIAKNDRKMRIEVGYGLEGVLPDVTANRIIREDVAPCVSRGPIRRGHQRRRRPDHRGRRRRQRVARQAKSRRRCAAAGSTSKQVLFLLFFVVPVAGGMLRGALRPRSADRWSAAERSASSCGSSRARSCSASSAESSRSS